MQTPQQKPRWFERLGYALPRLERDDRKALLERVEVGADGGVDYLIMMLLFRSGVPGVACGFHSRGYRGYAGRAFDGAIDWRGSCASAG